MLRLNAAWEMLRLNGAWEMLRLNAAWEILRFNGNTVVKLVYTEAKERKVSYSFANLT